MLTIGVGRCAGAADMTAGRPGISPGSARHSRALGDAGLFQGSGSAQAGSRMQPARLHGSGSKGAHPAASGRRTANVRIDVRISVHGVVHLPVLQLRRPGSRRSDGHLRWSPADMVKNGLSQASPGQAPSPAMRRGPPTRRGASGMERRAPAKGTVPFRRVIVITVGVRRSAFEAPQGRC